MNKINEQVGRSIIMAQERQNERDLSTSVEDLARVNQIIDSSRALEA